MPLDLDIANAVANAPRRAVVNGADASPEQASKNIETGQTLGVPTEAIETDPKYFEQIARQRQNAQIIEANPTISSWVTQFPDAAKIANDDFQNLHSLTERLRETHKSLREPLTGLTYEQGQQYLGDVRDIAGGALRDIANTPERLTGRISPEERQTLKANIKSLGLTDEQAEQELRILEPRMARGEALQTLLFSIPTILASPFIAAYRTSVSRPIEELGGLPKEVTEGLTFVGGAFLGLRQIGRMLESIPPGVHPAFDLAKKEQATSDAEGLAAIADQIKNNVTRQRSPEAMERLLDVELEGRRVGIDPYELAKIADKIKDKDLADEVYSQLPSALATGQDVQVSLARLLARAPELAEGLAPNLRTRPTGLTVEEVEALPEFKPDAEVINHPQRYRQVPWGENPGEEPIEFGKGQQVPYIAEIKYEDGMYNVYLDGALENAFGVKSDAERYLRVYFAGKTRAPGILNDNAELGLDPLFVKEEPKSAEASTETKPKKETSWGLTKSEINRYLKRVESLRADREEAIFRAERQSEERKQTAEWKENEKETRGEVETDLRYSTFLADDFFRTDKLPNEAAATPLKLDATLLDNLFGKGTAESLPAYATAKKGVHPDAVASRLGYDSGQQMVEQLALLERERRGSGLKPIAFRNAKVAEEIARRMEERYGDLAENIREATSEATLHETQADILADEMLGIARLLDREPPFTKETLKAGAAEAFEQTPLNIASVFANYLRNVGKQGREAEKALLAGKYEEAFIAKQRQFLAFLHAREAFQLQKDLQKAQRLAQRYSNAKTLDGVVQEYTDRNHWILEHVGFGTKRDPMELSEALGKTNLVEWAAGKERSGAELPVADFLTEDFQKPFDELTVGEFRAVHETMQAIDHNGRTLKKVEIAGKKAELAELITGLTEQLAQFPEIKYPLHPGIKEKLRNLPRWIGARNLPLETIFTNIDRNDPTGLFTQSILRRAMEAENFESELNAQVHKMYLDLVDNKTLSEKLFGPGHNYKITNDLFYHQGRGGLLDMRRQDLIGVMLNMGNDSNFAKLVRGYGLVDTTSESAFGMSLKEQLEAGKQRVRDFVDARAKKEDWDFVQGVWDIFDHLNGHAKEMQRRMSGVPATEIPAVPVKTPFGEYKGGFVRVSYDKIGNPRVETLKGGEADIEGPDYIRATTPKGYTKERTGYVGPLDLNAGKIPAQLQHIIHDIAFREAIADLAKIFYDDDFKNAFTQHYGKQYTNELDPWLKRLANPRPSDSANAAAGAVWLNWFRQNITSSLIWFNPSTVMKHTPTALGLSINEIGGKNFARGLKDFIADRNEARFAFEHSGELKNRRKYWQDSVAGGQSQALGRAETFGDMLAAFTHGEFAEGFDIARAKNVRAGSWPVAMGDMLSAVPTWIAKYREAMEESGNHSDAVFLADRAVQRAHGSMRGSAQPSAMAEAGTIGRFFTGLYHFFNRVLAKHVEATWQVGDAFGHFKNRETGEGMRDLMGAGNKVFWTFIIPAIVEELVTPLTNDEHESWGKRAVMAGVKQASADFLYVRDIAHAMLTGHDPQMGMMGAAANTVKQMKDDVVGQGRRAGEKWLIHTLAAFSMASGILGAQAGKTGHFVKEFMKGNERPSNVLEFARGLRYGASRPPKPRRH